MICFDLLSMGLSQSHDFGCGFDRLTRVDLGYFFVYFLWGYSDLMTGITDLVG
jgi:hypothetical protein